MLLALRKLLCKDGTKVKGHIKVNLECKFLPQERIPYDPTHRVVGVELAQHPAQVLLSGHFSDMDMLWLLHIMPTRLLPQKLIDKETQEFKGW